MSAFDGGAPTGPVTDTAGMRGCDGGGALVEETTTDNAAGAVLELEGDAVTVLWAWAHYLGGPRAPD